MQITNNCGETGSKGVGQNCQRMTQNTTKTDQAQDGERSDFQLILNLITDSL